MKVNNKTFFSYSPMSVDRSPYIISSDEEEKLFGRKIVHLIGVKIATRERYTLPRKIWNFAMRFYFTMAHEA